MAENTPNHELNQFEQGDTDWSHTADMEKIERRLVVRDAEERRTEYTPHDGALFIATDTGAVYDGTGSAWSLAKRECDSMALSALNGGIADRSEPITSLPGDIYYAKEGEDDPTREDGDLVFYYSDG